MYYLQNWMSFHLLPCTGDTVDATNAVKTIAVTATTSTIPISDLMFDIRADKIVN